MVDVIRLRDEEELTWEEVAKRAGLGSETAARRLYRKQKSKREAQAVLADQYQMLQRVAGDNALLDVPVRPLNVTLPPVAATLDEGMVTALVLGDTHVPHHDPVVQSIILRVLMDLRPTKIIHVGDLLDCYSLSNYDKNPDRMETLQDEINQARQYLASLRMASPTSEVILLEGNHEDRLRRTLWRSDLHIRPLLELTQVREFLTWPRLLGLRELEVTWVPTIDQSHARLLPKMVIKHGSVVRSQSAYTARAEHDRYGMSGMSGHTHRMGTFWTRDHNGSHVWQETGCTCRLDAEYVTDPNWQQGFVVVTVDPRTGANQIEPVFVANGLAVWRGNVYKGDA